MEFVEYAQQMGTVVLFVIGYAMGKADSKSKENA